MKTLKSTDLPGLPQQVRSLIADGVYSLYELTFESARYVLLTAKGAEFYFISEKGDLVNGPPDIQSVKDLTLGSPVMIAADSASPRLNVG